MLLFGMRAVYAIIVAMCLMLSGCGDDNGQTFKTTLRLEDTGGNATDVFPLGQPVTFVLSITNLTDSAQTLRLPTTMEYELLVAENFHTPVIWRRFREEIFDPFVTILDFAPGETKDFIETWPQIDYFFELVPRGVYIGQGFIATAGELAEPHVTFETDIRSPAIFFTIN